jgi:hypothetical protein
MHYCFRFSFHLYRIAPEWKVVKLEVEGVQIGGGRRSDLRWKEVRFEVEGGQI